MLANLKLKKLPEALKLSKESQDMTNFLAMVVRNAMEDFHHKYLSDEQMKELNPIIRNAIYTGLYALQHRRTSKGAKAFVAFQTKLIPHYWEAPKLMIDFMDTVKMLDDRMD